MADGYWNRQPTMNPTTGMLKRPRSDYDLPTSGVPSTQVMHNYLSQDGNRGGLGVNETKTIGSAYGHYLQHEQLNSFTSAEASSFGEVGLGRRAGGSGITGFPLAGTMARTEAVHSDIVPNGRGLGFAGRLLMDAPNGRGLGFDGRLPVDAPRGGGVGFDGRLPVDAMPRLTRETVPLPPDASNTLYVEGLPSNVTRREVAHIFRPFVGYEEVRLVSKESRHRGGDPLILCFVDFTNPACAATALSALQDYKMDEHDRDSAHLRLQFSKFPGARAGTKPRGKR